MKSLCFHGWLRAAELARVEAEYESRLRLAEQHREELERKYDGQFQSVERKRERLETDYDDKFRAAEAEKARLLAILEKQKHEQKYKAAMALVGRNSRGMKMLAMQGWLRAVEQEAQNREVQARIVELDTREAQLKRQHDSQLSALDEQMRGLQRDHDAALRRLAEEEARKTKQVQGEFRELQDTFDIRIRQMEDKHFSELKARDDERENKLKEAKALALMHGDILRGQADSAAVKIQAKMVKYEHFVAWSQYCRHQKLNRAADQWTLAHKTEAKRQSERRENAAELLALRGCSRMALFEVFRAWEQLVVSELWHLTSEDAAKKITKEQRYRKTEAVMLVLTSGDRRLMLTQYLLAWAHCVKYERGSQQARDELARRHRLERARAKGLATKFALMQWDTSGHILGKQILSAWWLLIREGRWNSSYQEASRAAGMYCNREHTLMARTLLSADRNNVKLLRTIAFGVWKSGCGASRSFGDYKARRERLLDRWGMQYGVAKASLFWHRILAGWTRVAKEARGTTKLEQQIAYLRMKHQNTRDGCSGVFVSLHFRSFIHFLLHDWLVYSMKSGVGKIYKEANWSLAQEMEDNEIFRTTFLLQGLFTRWKHWTANAKHQDALEALRLKMYNQHGRMPTRVLTVVSAIEDQRDRLMLWESFARWSLITRMERVAAHSQMVPITRYWTKTYLPQSSYLPAVTAPPVTSYVYPNQVVSSPSPMQVSTPSAPNLVSWRVVNEAAPAPLPAAPVTRMELPAVRAELPPMATVGIDSNHDGRANFWYTGVDMNRDGIPDSLQQPSVASIPTATVAVDANCDGRANYLYTGADMNRDGIPDALQGSGILGSRTAFPDVLQGSGVFPSRSAVSDAYQGSTVLPARTVVQTQTYQQSLSPRAITPSRINSTPTKGPVELVANQTGISNATNYGLRLHSATPRWSVQETDEGQPLSPRFEGPAFSEVISPRSQASASWRVNQAPPMSLTSSVQSITSGYSPSPSTQHFPEMPQGSGSLLLTQPRFGAAS